MNASLVRFVIIQPAAALYIPVPVFESTGEPALGGICSGRSQIRMFACSLPPSSLWYSRRRMPHGAGLLSKEAIV
jgi:hypothetical protein